MQLDTINRLYLELSQVATAKTARELELEELLRSACAIAERQGQDTHWTRFINTAHQLGINGVTPRTYRILESDTPQPVCTVEPTPPSPSFNDELKHLINRHSIENQSNTPDFILADFLEDCLSALSKAIRRQNRWFSSNPPHQIFSSNPTGEKPGKADDVH